MLLIDLTNQSFNHWTVLKRGETKNKETHWVCRCICGVTKPVNAKNLRSGLSKSCGCQSGKEFHGASNTAECRTWKAIWQRCTNPNDEYWYLYGGRGIRVDPKWVLFENFIADMGLRPSPKHSLDRFPNQNGPYSPDNCRWATAKQQARNTRANRIIEFNGESLCVAEWADRTGIGSSLIRARIDDLRWSIADALSIPAGGLYSRKKFVE